MRKEGKKEMEDWCRKNNWILLRFHSEFTGTSSTFGLFSDGKPPYTGPPPSHSDWTETRTQYSSTVLTDTEAKIGADYLEGGRREETVGDSERSRSPGSDNGGDEILTETSPKRVLVSLERILVKFLSFKKIISDRKISTKYVDFIWVHRGYGNIFN